MQKNIPLISATLQDYFRSSLNTLQDVNITTDPRDLPAGENNFKRSFFMHRDKLIASQEIVSESRENIYGGTSQSPALFNDWIECESLLERIKKDCIDISDIYYGRGKYKTLPDHIDQIKDQLVESIFTSASSLSRATIRFFLYSHLQQNDRQTSATINDFKKQILVGQKVVKTLSNKYGDEANKYNRQATFWLKVACTLGVFALALIYLVHQNIDPLSILYEKIAPALEVTSSAGKKSIKEAAQTISNELETKASKLIYKYQFYELILAKIITFSLLLGGITFAARQYAINRHNAHIKNHKSISIDIFNELLASEHVQTDKNLQSKTYDHVLDTIFEKDDYGHFRESKKYDLDEVIEMLSKIKS